MSITIHAVLYQKSEEISQGVADFNTSVFQTKRSFRSNAKTGLTRHLAPFWSILATFPRLGRSFLHYLSSHLGRAFLHYLFCFSQMNSSALFVLFFTDVLFGAFRASRSRLAATGVNEVNNSIPGPKMPTTPV